MQVQNRQTYESESFLKSSTPSLRKGGGALSGISEKFSANPATGTFSFSIPLPVSPARALTPELSLNYDSGSGGSAFGLGWSCTAPSVSRSTDKGLPTYVDHQDVFILSGADDMVPVLNGEGVPVRNVVTEAGIDWSVSQYQPRTEASFARIEHWRNPETGESHWRVWSSSNTISVFGLKAEDCVSDPRRPDRIYRWMLSRVFDVHGNLAVYRYRRDDDEGMDDAAPQECQRKGKPQAQVYLDRVFYGNRTPFSGVEPTDSDFCFSLQFSYGDNAAGAWRCRPDAFSAYRPGFELRTRRLCSQISCQHNFPEDGLVFVPVKTLVLKHETPPFGQARLTSVVLRAHGVDADGMTTTEDMPPLAFGYSDPEPPSAQAERINLTNSDKPYLPLADAQWSWEDLLAEALPGVVDHTAGTVGFSRNSGRGIDPRHALALVPSKPIEGPHYTTSLAGSAQRTHVIEASGVHGRHDTGSDGNAALFHATSAVPHAAIRNADMRVLDLDGDGIGDLVFCDGERLYWYPARGTQGHHQALPVSLPVDEPSSPRFVFAEGQTGVHVADMTGDGLVDVVRITASSVTYWPNLGHGRFGSAISMAGVGAIDHPDAFDPGRVRLVDLDGNGLTDLVYFRDGVIDIRVNDNGNGLAPVVRAVAPYRAGKPPDSAQFIDIRGTGLPCLVWTAEAGASGETPCFLWAIHGETKPHLLNRVDSPLGSLTTLEYKPSTAYYIADRDAGMPWATRLHFPVHCLAKVTVSDRVTGYSMATSYHYHHGCYDNDDRAFRGFGRVDTLETELENFGETDPATRLLHQPPVLTKTWYHTGSSRNLRDLSNAYVPEYFEHPSLAIPDLKPLLPGGLEHDEYRQGVRAAKGTPLRSEVYSLDGSPLEHVPYSIAVNRVRVVKRQDSRREPGADNDRGRWAVFQTLERDALTFTLDRKPDDARASESVVLAHDDFGNPLLVATIHHARASVPPGVPSFAADAQRVTHCVVSRTAYTDFREEGPGGIPNVLWETSHCRLTPSACETEVWEVRGLRNRIAGINDDLPSAFEALQKLQFDDHDTTGRRLLSSTRIRFFDDALSGNLPLGQIGRAGHAFRTETLAFTSAHVEAIYGTRLGTSQHEQDTALRDAYYRRSEDRGGNADPDQWWTFSATPGFADDPASNFHLPVSSTDIAGRTSWVVHDRYNLLGVSVTNPAGQAVRAINDYRLLAPRMVRDINGNWSAARHDAFGRPVSVAIMGKIETAGVPTGHEPCEGDNLTNPTQQFVYDLDAFVRSGRPISAHTIAFENHRFSGGDRSLTQKTYEHTGGLGQVIMIKVQSAPGVALREKPDGSIEPADTGTALRWIGNGRTVFNSKGQPLKQYEPYFSVTPDYETNPNLVEQGPGSTLLYDAAGRTLGVLNADGSWSKTVATPWMATAHDAGDTCLVERLSDDPDIGSRFRAAIDQLQDNNWLSAQRAPSGAAANRAADQSEAYGDTPAITHTDSLGRAIVAIVDAGSGHRIETRTVLDIEGNVRALVDSAGREVEKSLHSMLPPPGKDKPRPALWQALMDSGEKVVFLDALGRATLSWDARGHLARVEYDVLDRPVASHVTMPGGQVICTSRIDYGDTLPDAEARNMIGQVWRSFDQSGMAETLAVDFKGNVTRSSRRFVSAYQSDINWPDDMTARLALLEPETFVSKASFDALNRITRSTAPSADMPVDPAEPVDETQLTITEPAYDRGGLLSAMVVTVRGSAPVNHLRELTYDAKGQRQSVTYGNGVTTRYEYDPRTYRLTRMVSTAADGTVLQDCAYTYDIVGNIVAIHDRAVATTFFDNQQIDPLSTYVYDPLYRLRRATGREHAGRTGAPDVSTGNTTDTGLPGLHSLRMYEQIHDFDDHGNLIQLRHVAGTESWTRRYVYGGANNRLEKSWIGSQSDEPALPNFAHDAHGSMTMMPGTVALAWDFADRLRSVDKGNGPEAWYSYDGSGGRVRKVRHHTGTNVRSERLYFGGFEIYREFSGPNGTKRSERETLHVADDAGRIALVETLTVDNGAPVAAPQPLARYQLGNHLGSVALELDESGGEISREEYHPYGTSAFYSGVDGARAPPKRFRYTGKERDDETGFTYHGARYYAPWLGRWTAADPIGTGDGLNLYAYVGGRPVGSVDPGGTAEEEPDLATQALLVDLKREHAIRLEAEHRGVDMTSDEALKDVRQRARAQELSEIVDRQRSDSRHNEEVRTTIQALSHDQKILRNLARVTGGRTDEARILALVRAAEQYHFDVAVLTAVFFNEGLHNQTEGYMSSTYTTTGADLFVYEVPRLKAEGYLREDFAEGIDYFDTRAPGARHPVPEKQMIRNASLFDRHEPLIEGSTAILAAKRDFLNRDLDQLGLSYGGLTDQQQVYWLYIYYNAGERAGGNRLKATFHENAGQVPVTTRNFPGAATEPFSLDARFNAQRVLANFEYWRWAYSGQHDLDFANPRGPRF
jgi:RHS repeat-associated protein